MRGSKLTLFLCAGRKLYVFSVSDLSVRNRNRLGFSCREEIDLVAWLVEIGLLHVCWPKNTSFSDEDET